MKKIIVFTLLIAGIAGFTTSFAQDATGKKATKKEAKMDKKDEKMKPVQADKKGDKASKKEGKMDKKEAKGKM